MSKIFANGINIYYKEQGNPKSPLLILIGGLTRDHTIWSEILNQEEINAFRVIVYDNRGSGQTDQPEGAYSGELLANDLSALIEQLHLPPAIIVGHSMGGFTAQYLAALYPQKVEKLILCSTCIRQTEEGINYLNNLLGLSRKNTPIEQLMQTALPWLYTSSFLTEDRMRQIIEGAKSNPFPQAPHALEAQIMACIQHDSQSILPAIKAPTLVVTGKEDKVMTPSVCKELADKLPNATFIEVPNAAHMLQIEKPKLLSQIIQSFALS